MPDGKYKVVKLYDGEVSECNKYSEAKQAASSAAMMPAPAATANGTPDLVVCYKSDRAISTIQKMADGRWMVVKLYEEKAAEFDTFWVAEQVATNAAMTQAPRTKKDAA
ncbi:hypothetical protein [Pseudomonas sp. P8_250]|uniref:hypothetical protein n=1 Tax=Pseudomonas sp. P8_250 TaxID=3043446 RepID=UPI002A371D4E|nr:hypothetical protein [Pseudomonas sp. P8_250]MDX9668658.1 hypothetical protein [Pseudomonas sp. P8_250]